MERAAPRDPVNDFVDRTIEKRTIEEFRQGRFGGKRCLVLRAARDSGVTFFLEHLERTSDPRWFCVYSDCRSNDPEAIFRKFFDRVEERHLLRWKALSFFRELGEPLLRLAAGIAAAAALPWLAVSGPVAAAILPKVGTTPYASASSERFGKLITSGRWKRPVLFLVDNAQEIKPQSLHILNTAFGPQYEHVLFILSFIEESAAPAGWDEFHARLQGFGLDLQVFDFPPPDGTFVGEIASALGVSLSAEQRDELLRVTRRRASRLVAALTGTPTSTARMTVTEREILRYLIVAEQPLDRDDIRTIVLNSPRVVATEEAVLEAIDKLERQRLVTLTRHRLGVDVELAPGRDAFVRDEISELSANLVTAQEMYRHFATIQKMRSPRHSPSAYGALLYRLAQQVDPASLPVRAFELVRISLGQADLASARRYVDDAIGHNPKPDVANLYTLLAFHVSVQEYTQAAEIFASLGAEYWSQVRTLRIIHAVVMNRLRRHSESNAEIDELLAGAAATLEEFALLMSYKIAARLHEGDLARARAEFEEAAPRLRQARNRGYALRNCAAVYFWGDGRDLQRAEAVLLEASTAFRQTRDEFGYYTAVNNLASLAGSAADRNAATRKELPRFQETFEALSIYGTQHLEEVGTNLGIALLLNHDPARAATHLRKMIAISSFDFPRVLMESALAFAEVQLGESASARTRMGELTARVTSIPLPEAVYWAHFNAAAVEAAAGGTMARFDEELRAATASGFWGGQNSYRRLVAAVQQARPSAQALPELLGYDLLQYWSQNPLSVLTPAALP
jgi:hypothetical protein